MTCSNGPYGWQLCGLGNNGQHVGSRRAAIWEHLPYCHFQKEPNTSQKQPVAEISVKMEKILNHYGSDGNLYLNTNDHLRRNFFIVFFKLVEKSGTCTTVTVPSNKSIYV